METYLPPLLIAMDKELYFKEYTKVYGKEIIDTLKYKLKGENTNEK